MTSSGPRITRGTFGAGAAVGISAAFGGAGAAFGASAGAGAAFGASAGAAFGASARWDSALMALLASDSGARSCDLAGVANVSVRPGVAEGLRALFAPSRALSPVSYTHLTLPTILRV